MNDINKGASAFFAGLNIPNLVSTVAAVVGLVERLFRGRGLGRKKRAKALNALVRVFGHDAGVPDEVAAVLGILIDVLGKGANKGSDFQAVIDRVIEVFGIVTEATRITAGLIGDDREVVEAVVAFVNGEVDIPALNEGLEELLIRFMVDIALKQVRQVITDDTPDGDTAVSAPRRPGLDIPF